MAVFDKASLVMIPSQYKEGKIYNIKPEDQSSSFEFERGSAATRVNSSGLIEYVGKGEELVTNGTFDADSDWLKTGDWSINGGVAIGVSSGNLSQNLSYEANEYYLLEFEIKNYVSGSFGVRNGNITVQTVTPSGNGIYSVTQQASGSYNTVLFFNSGSFNGQIDNVSVKRISNDTPRLDYSGTEPALLLEPQRTNLVSNSEYFDTFWSTASGGTRIHNQIISPEGIQNGTKMYPTSTGSFRGLSKAFGSTLSNTSYALSVFAKAGEFEHLFFYNIGSPDGNNGVWFNLTTGSVGTNQSAWSSAKMEDFGNGWYRCSAVITAGGSSDNLYILLADSNSSVTATKNGTDGLYLYGAQLEQGSYATSYIPTNGQTETRLYDGMNCDLSNVLGTGDATFIFDFDFDTLRESGAYLYRVYSGTDSFGLKVSSTTNRTLQLRAISGFTNHISINEAASETLHKMAVRITGSVVEVFYNGTKITSTMTGLPSYNWNLYEITGNNSFIGKTKQLLVFPEALSDNECINLTTL